MERNEEYMMSKMINIKKTIITQQKVDRAFKYGYEIGRSKQPFRNKCRYNSFQLREKWLQGYERALVDRRLHV